MHVHQETPARLSKASGLPAFRSAACFFQQSNFITFTAVFRLREQALGCFKPQCSREHHFPDRRALGDGWGWLKLIDLDAVTRNRPLALVPDG
jgi:hypothetical protein